MTRFYRAGAGPSFQTKGYTGYKTAWDQHPFTDWKTISSVAYMESSSHRWNRNTSGFQGDVGGPWLMEDVILSFQPTVLQQFGLVASGGYGHCQQKAYTASADLVSLSKRTPPTDPTQAKGWVEGYTGGADTSDMISKGSTAIARVAPTNPATDTAAAIGELLRDGLPSLPGKEGNIGSEYLNLQFAWSPTINDGRSFIKAIRHQGDIQDQISRDSGRLVRRRYEFPQEQSVSTSTQTGVYPGYWDGPTADVVSTGTRVTTTTTTKKTWFSGAFTYHIPKSAWGRTVYNLDRKYGLLPGLDTGWELTPYSWLVDWFSNAGNVIHNLNAFSEDGLVMAYGYVMQETIKKIDCSWTGNLSDNFASTKHKYTLHDSIIYRTRARVQATPYGFGLTWDGFNPFQLSILAALGISRAF